MDDERRGRLTELMGRIADGDRAAPFTLYSEFGGAIATQMRRHLRRMGVPNPSPEDVDGLVLDACLALSEVAAGWDPDGGALPWTWAEARLRRLAARFVGQHADPLGPSDPETDGGPAGAPGPSTEPEAFEVLARLVATAGDSTVGLLADAIRAAGLSARDQRILLEFAVQKVTGDPSPGHTLAPVFDLQPDAVRQAVCRGRKRLRAVIGGDPRFAPLATIPLVA